jgi:hypothetical protein
VARDTAAAGLITAETMYAAMTASNESGLTAVDERLAAAGVDASAARREAALVVDVWLSYGFTERDAIRGAFLGGLELGARCARLVP